jgi:hypothetical protein
VNDLIQRMTACGDCRTLAVAYGMNLLNSRRPGANPRDWGLRTTETLLDLDDHLIAEHAEWLPGRRPDCDICEDWRRDNTHGPLDVSEARHRAWHLCEPLRQVCVPGGHALTELML